MPESHPGAQQVKRYRPLAELVPARWQTGFVHADDGTHLHYTRTGGDKPALVLLHGMMCSGLMWLRVALALESEFDVIMPDTRGHGLSGRLEHGMTMKRLVGDAAMLIQALKLDKPAVVGHSLGAETAGWLAINFPALVRRVVLVDPPLNIVPPDDTPPGEVPPGLKAIFDIMDTLRAQPPEQQVITALNFMPPDSAWDEPDYMSAVAAITQFDTGYRPGEASPDLISSPDEIARIECPILLMSSRPMTPGIMPPGIGIFEANWRQGEHVHFADSGHYIQVDAFERFIDITRGFLLA